MIVARRSVLRAAAFIDKRHASLFVRINHLFSGNRSGAFLRYSDTLVDAFSLAIFLPGKYAAVHLAGAAILDDFRASRG